MVHACELDVPHVQITRVVHVSYLLRENLVHEGDSLHVFVITCVHACKNEV